MYTFTCGYPVDPTRLVEKTTLFCWRFLDTLSNSSWPRMQESVSGLSSVLLILSLSLRRRRACLVPVASQSVACSESSTAFKTSVLNCVSVLSLLICGAQTFAPLHSVCLKEQGHSSWGGSIGPNLWTASWRCLLSLAS